MADVLTKLFVIIQSREHAKPDGSYVASLFHKGEDYILKKIGEEATETIIAGKGSNKQELAKEIADLWFHSLVLLRYEGLDLEDVLRELESRFGKSGIEEKKQRKNKTDNSV
mgnify:CR=1 FL=1